MHEQRTAIDEDMTAANPEDEEVKELKAYLDELREQFQVTQDQQETHMNKMRDDYSAYMDYINRIKTQGVSAAYDNPEEMAGTEIEAT